ncbi:dnaE [Wigglesworthia glossinidia endosymbiont of Glossina brevipalpis]|uniref:DNA polymerase III subunit alpha n=1 Tax=Wigglesworthia glossinidia brevipalpis TaxID=36870 RepID=Q8D2H5_WIGBR|nr:dnaE [Wigglesworthia glossinidia endosymbiont of Glossina brevipalpis]
MSKTYFIHLRIHSDYSIIDGLPKIETIINRAKKLNMPALAITDFTNLYGLIKFYIFAKKNGIKPIIGSDFYLKKIICGKEEISEITILASNNMGYKNLILLISKAYQFGQTNIGPTINLYWLSKYNSGLIILSGGIYGEIGKYLIKNNLENIKYCINFYKKYFHNRYYLEITRTGKSEEEIYINYALNLSINYNIPLVATNNVRFIFRNDFNVHNIKVSIYQNTTLKNLKKNNYTDNQYMKCEKEMCDLFSDIPESLENSIEIAKRCNVNIELNKYHLPHFSSGELSPKKYIINKSYLGLEKKLDFLFPNSIEKNKNKKKYETRLKNELKVINKMKFPSYFLIIMEFISWAKKNNIPVGPGRGSGAGSLVAYSLNITDIDPLSFGLLFERFLNPERISMPDFDIDFCMEKRDLVINHVANIYGKKSVAQIITFGKMTARSVIKDVGRVLGFPYRFVDKISKLIPLDPGVTLEKSLNTEHQLIKLYSSDEEVKKIIDMSKNLEGLIKNVSKHAGGIVISPKEITNFTPIYYDIKNNTQITQFDKDDIEKIGLVKFDFLGLRTLTIIDWTVKIINKKREKNNLDLIDISKIPLNDIKSFELLKKSKTISVFQLESKGIRDLIKRLQPDCFEDIISLVALFRPGPLKSGMVENFINRKHGKEKIFYPDKNWQHELLEPILKSTYGIILYQEQVMSIAQVLAGYSLGEADILRRAMGKKKVKEMSEQRNRFKNGALKNGIDKIFSMKIFDLLEKFSGYGFNKSHSAAYALLSYQTLWLKTHYATEFMSSAMSADMDNSDRIISLINECKNIGIKILLPDINTCNYHFKVVDKKIIYGLGAIKGIGLSSIKEIKNQIKKNGNFTDLFDLCLRSDPKKLTRKTIEKLIFSGALDKLNKDRSFNVKNLPYAMKFAQQKIKNKKLGQIDMFNYRLKSKYIFKHFESSMQNFSILEEERNMLGIYLSNHPMKYYLQEFIYYSNRNLIKNINKNSSGKNKNICGMISSVKKIYTKSGDIIISLLLEDSSDILEVILFLKEYEKYKYLIKKNQVVVVYGKIFAKSSYYYPKIICNKITNIYELRKKFLKKINIIIFYNFKESFSLNRIKQILNKFKSGNILIKFFFNIKNKNFPLHKEKNFQIDPSEEFIKEINSTIGIKKIHLEFKKIL